MKKLFFFAVIMFLGSISLPINAQVGQQPLTKHTEPASFNYYLLSMTWSPTFCLNHKLDHEECGGKYPGFVLHGLWPLITATNWPMNCSTAQQLTPEAVAFGDKIYPNKSLVIHEWEKHGTCSGMDALNYFETAEKALLSVKVPQILQDPKTSLTMSYANIIQSFTSVNPVLSPDKIVLECSHSRLTEVRVCLGKDLTSMSCNGEFKTQCPSNNIVIPAQSVSDLH